MSDLLMQTIIETLEAQGLLLQTMAKDADKAQLEVRKKLIDLSIPVPPQQPPPLDLTEIKQLFADIKALIAKIPQQQPVKPQPRFLLKKETWLIVFGFCVFMGMAWGWGYTFRISSEYEMGAAKYIYMKRMPHPHASRLCRQTDSFFLANPAAIYEFLPRPFAGEKEKIATGSAIKTR